MTKNVVTMSVKGKIRDAARIMIERGISSLPIVENDVPIGIVTKTDMLELIARKDMKDIPNPDDQITKIMTTPIITIKQNDPLKKAIDTMSERKFEHLVVTGDNGKIAGILSTLDIARAYGNDDTQESEV